MIFSFSSGRAIFGLLVIFIAAIIAVIAVLQLFVSLYRRGMRPHLLERTSRSSSRESDAQ